VSLVEIGSVDSLQSRLRAGDTLRVGSVGLHTRRLRTGLSTLGISIGIAAMVGVLGLSESSRADLQAQIRALGTNLLEIQAGQGFGAGDATLPDTAVPMISRVGPVTEVSATSPVDATVRRTDFVDEDRTGGISVVATDPTLLDTLHADVVDGAWFDAATATYPNVVLGSITAGRLGIGDAGDGIRVWIGERWFTVIGILEPIAAAPDLNRSVIVGLDAAETYLADDDLPPGTVYVRTIEGSVDVVRSVLPGTADPASPEEVQVSRPSDALEAEAAADEAFTSLFLGLGAVALLVGGIGIANVMVIAVIERRTEIGLRRALGATRAHIRRQFLTEALLLAGMGGVAGVALGAALTAIYAFVEDWQIVIPPVALVGGVAAALLIGAVAGLYPAVRAARLAPTEALRSA
jgi:putative ABC transport system permease protein